MGRWVSAAKPELRQSPAAVTAVGLLLSLLGLLAGGCAQELPPQEVADRFWRAVVTGHPGKIRRYVLRQQRDTLANDAEILPVSTFTLGRIVIDGERATIDTRIILESDSPVPLTIPTQLVQEQQQWRVDYDATVNAISSQSELARVIGKIGALGDSLQQGIEQSVDEMKQALPVIEQELARLEGRIKQAMPELREKLETFAKRLEESLEESLQAPPPPPPQAPPPAEGTIAL